MLCCKSTILYTFKGDIFTSSTFFYLYYFLWFIRGKALEACISVGFTLATNFLLYHVHGQ